MSTEEKTEKPESVSINLKFGWVGGGIYVALGILYHLVMGDGPFSWSDPWLYVTMFVWPFFILGWVIAFFAITVAVVFGGASLIDWKNGRKNRLLAVARREAMEAEREERRRAAAKATPSVSILDD